MRNSSEIYKLKDLSASDLYDKMKSFRGLNIKSRLLIIGAAIKDIEQNTTLRHKTIVKIGRSLDIYNANQVLKSDPLCDTMK